MLAAGVFYEKMYVFLRRWWFPPLKVTLWSVFEKHKGATLTEQNSTKKDAHRKKDDFVQPQRNFYVFFKSIFNFSLYMTTSIDPGNHKTKMFGEVSKETEF